MHNKTLIISSYAPPKIGGPQNLYNLLRDANPDSYCILTSFYAIDNMSAKLGTWLPGKYIFYDNTSATKNIAMNNTGSTTVLKRRDFVTKIKHFLKRFKFVQELFVFIVIISQIIAIIFVGKKTIKNKRIDSMMGVSDYGAAMIGTYIIHRITKKPYSIFLFDLYHGNNLPFFVKQLAFFFEPKIFNSATNMIVTNEGTLEYYKKKYTKKITDKIIVIHNSIYPEGYEKIQCKKNKKTNLDYNITFTGSISWPQINSLKNLIVALNELSDIKIKLKIYSPSPLDYLKKIGIEKSKKVEIFVASVEKMPEIQSAADILFLPLSWNTDSQAIINTATPGKLTDYLIAGRPILIHAPPTSYLVKYAKENNFAYIVDKEDIEELKNGIKKLLLDKEYTQKIVENAEKTFYKNHDANKNSIIFKCLSLYK